MTAKPLKGRSAGQPPGLLSGIVANMPASYFAIVLGLTSLGTVWRVAERAWQPPNFVAECAYVVAGVAWTALVAFTILKTMLAGAGLRQASSRAFGRG